MTADYIVCPYCSYIIPGTFGCTLDPYSIEVTCPKCDEFVGARYSTSPATPEDYADSSPWIQMLINNDLEFKDVTSEDLPELFRLSLVYVNRRLDFLETTLQELIDRLSELE